jgi:iron(III) transport system permease protein
MPKLEAGERFHSGGSWVTDGSTSFDLPAARPEARSLGGALSRLDWKRIVFILIFLLLVWQVVIPFTMVIWTSLKTVRPGDQGFLDATFTLGNYVRAFAAPQFWQATWNTLLFATVSTVCSFVGGTFLAWAVERTNTPLARFCGLVTIGRMIIPGILVTVSWIFVASPNIGLANWMAAPITGGQATFNIYSFWGMVWVNSLESIPLCYLLVSASFQAMDPRLEDASTMTGASTWRTFSRITLPLAWPAVVSICLLQLISSIESFEIPLLLGGRARLPVYATEVYYNVQRQPTDWGMASTYSVSLLALAIVLLIGYFNVVKYGERYQTITGKDYRPRRIDLGLWRYLTSFLMVSLVFLITGVPMLVIAYASLQPYFRPPTWANLMSPSLNNYKLLIVNNDWNAVPALWNSTLLGLGTATGTMLVVAAIAYFVIKTRMPGRRLLDFLAFSTIALPGVVVGAAFLWFYLLVPLPIIGSLLIIGLAYLTKYMPIALRFISASMLQIHGELEEAAAVAGVPWWKNFMRIYLPLLRPGFMAGWFWVMVHAYRELTISLMLARGNNRTASVIIYDLAQQSWNLLAAFGVIMFVLLIALVAASHVLSKRFGVQEQS